jgi:hypothetical protein
MGIHIDNNVPRAELLPAYAHHCERVWIDSAFFGLGFMSMNIVGMFFIVPFAGQATQFL